MIGTNELPVRRCTEVLTNLISLRKVVADWKSQGLTIALVPTMGALHLGHIELVRHALSTADRVIASIFVNPIQFTPEEDFQSYPRRQREDLSMLSNLGVDAVYTPNTKEMYSKSFQTRVEVPELSAVLCGKTRPKHFSGVATIVVKLLQQTQADFAVFGEKDFQQLSIIRQVAIDLDIPVKIIGVPTVRDKDGLALSSRNAYLTEVERVLAPKLHSELLCVVEDVVNGEDALLRCQKATDFLLQEGFLKVDYLEIRDSNTLSIVISKKNSARVFCAAYIGKTRLLDNIALLVGEN